MTFLGGVMHNMSKATYGSVFNVKNKSCYTLEPSGFRKITNEKLSIILQFPQVILHLFGPGVLGFDYLLGARVYNGHDSALGVSFHRPPCLPGSNAGRPHGVTAEILYLRALHSYTLPM